MSMSTTRPHIFSLGEAAVAYALAAERLVGDTNKAIVPIFVSMLFQSLEISIKHAGIESGLFTAKEARATANRSGHGVNELAALAVTKLGGDPFEPIITAMTFCNSGDRSAGFIRAMICGNAMAKTRDAYATRRLGYGEVRDGDFALIKPIAEWVAAIKETALGLPTTIDILTQWHASPSKSKNFAIWLQQR